MATKESSPRKRVPTLQSIPVAKPDLAAMHALIAEEMAAVNQRITEGLRSRVALVDEVGHYIVEGGGKRLRPSLVISSALAYGYEGRSHLDLAAIIEFIHTATLLHDDVVDASALRRGKETANAVWGNDASVLVGDFLYSRAFQMMVEVGSMRIMELLADATNAIAEGEVQQLLNCHDPETSEARYLEVIRLKTAKLFEAAAQVGPILNVRSSFDEKVMARYGMHLGTAYQLVDDVLDYRGTAGEIGKNVGDDLAEGKPTLPLIHAIKTGTEAEQRVVRGAIRHGGLAQLEHVVDAVESTGAIAYTARKARAEADIALEALDDVPPSPYRDALEQLAEFTVSRTY